MKKLDNYGLWLATKSPTATDPAEAELYDGVCKPFVPINSSDAKVFGPLISQQQPEVQQQLKSRQQQQSSTSTSTVVTGPATHEPELQDLLAAVKKAAGVYIDPQHPHQQNLDDIVIVTGCNYGFLNHLHNFKCFLDRLGMKFLVVAMDHQSYSYLTNQSRANTIGSSMSVYYAGAGKVGEVGTGPVDFRSKAFNILTAKKKEAVHDILRLGYSVLFSDTDVVLVQDPLPYLLWHNVDYVHSINAICTK